MPLFIRYARLFSLSNCQRWEYIINEKEVQFVCVYRSRKFIFGISAGKVVGSFITLCGLMVAHTFYRNDSREILKRNAKFFASAGIGIGAVLILYVIVMLIAGRYLSIVEGAPSPIYPLDACLYAVLYIVLGILVHLYFKKHEESGLYEGPVRAPISKKFGPVLMSLHFL